LIILERGFARVERLITVAKIIPPQFSYNP
jgi:hypothetical protein